MTGTLFFPRPNPARFPGGAGLSQWVRPPHWEGAATSRGASPTRSEAECGEGHDKIEGGRGRCLRRSLAGPLQTE